MWKAIGKRVELEGATPLKDHVYLGCNHRNTNVDESQIAAKADLFRRITTARVTDESGINPKPEQEASMAMEKVMNAKNISTQSYEKLAKDTKAWSYDMEGHAIQCVERYCELAGKEIGKLILHVKWKCSALPHSGPQNLSH